METIVNSFLNKGLQQLTELAGSRITGAIKQAADKTGVDFAYLMQQAKAESSFQSDAKARTSSATGLFQFIESTWMSMVERYGDKHGIDTSAPRGAVLALRKDPVLASKMAAEFAHENKGVLERNWGGDIGATELYFAHFLGAGSASAFLKARDENGAAPAAVLFPKAAKANAGVFYDRGTGRAKSLDEVYAFFDQKFEINEDSRTGGFEDLMVASIPSPVSSRAKPRDLPFMAEISPLRSAPVEMTNRGLASYQSLIMNQMDLILLTQQMDLPLMGERSSNKLI
jgi:hypothetical protein